tara:strand:- start:493 stop:981 length:489 start_codon:yes stop_codon:yes gene_type:complete
MTVIRGKVQEKTEKANRNGDPFLAFKIDVGRQYPVSVNDFEMIGSVHETGDSIVWEIEEQAATGQGGKAITYRNLVALLDEDDGPDLSGAEFDQPQSPASQERRGGTSGVIDGQAFGNARNVSAALIAGFMQAYNRMPEGDDLAALSGTQLELETMLYEQRP